MKIKTIKYSILIKNNKFKNYKCFIKKWRKYLISFYKKNNKNKYQAILK